MADRFPELSQNGQGTKAALNVFREYLKERKVDEESLLSLTRRTSWRMHITVLRRFYAEARKKNDELYTKASLVGIRFEKCEILQLC